jgi:hypothetical protein
MMGSNYQAELKYNKNIQFEQKGSMESKWIHKHPSIPGSFLAKIDPPNSASDAHIKRQCHEQSVDDFKLQIEIIDHEMSMLRDCDGNLLEYNEENFADLENRKLKLLMSKRFHQNAAHAYWYSEHMLTFPEN